MLLTRTKALRFLLGLVLVAGVGLAACDDDDDDVDATPTDGTPTNGEIGTVNVLGIWGDDELASFEAMVEGWEGSMDFTGTRDITPVLTTRVEGGNPPDVAIPAEIGLFQQFAREDRLTPLSACPGLEDVVRNNYPESFIELGTVDGELYGFFMKADTKATVFYNPTFFEENNLEPLGDDATFDDLIALSDQILSDTDVPPWSRGEFANGGTGFPGSDTIQQIVLNEAGEDAYDGVVDGSVSWTDDRMRDAWEKFGQLVLTDGYVVQGGAEGVNATNFEDAVFPPFESPPRAAMVHIGGFGAGFITEQFPDAEAGTDFDVFPWPGGGVTGGANIAYAFNSNPTTCSFLMHIAGADAQEIWVERGGFTSLNSEVDLNLYPDDVARAQAEQLLEAEVFRFDLDDAIGGAVQQAVFQGVTEYLANPGNLDQILQSIQDAVGTEPEPEDDGEDAEDEGGE